MCRDETRTLFGTLCLLFALTNLGRTAFAPLVETLRVAFDASPAAVGVVVSLAWAGSAGGRPVSAYLVTRLRRDRVVALAGVVLAAGASLAALASSLAALRVGAVVAGLSSGVYVAAAVPLVGALFPERVGRALGVHGAVAQVAAVAAPGLVFAAALLADWRAAFWVLAVVGALTAAGVLAVARVTSMPASTAPDPGVRAALSHPRVFAAGVAVVAAAGFVWQGLFNFYVTYLVTERGFATAGANGALSLLFAAGIPGMAVGGRLADRLPTVPYLIALVATFALAVVGATLAGTVGLLALSTVASLAIHALFPSLDTYVLGALPASSRASAYAVFSSVALALEAPGSAAVGVVAARVGFGGAFRAFALALLPVAVGLAAADRLGWFPSAAPD